MPSRCEDVRLWMEFGVQHYIQFCRERCNMQRNEAQKVTGHGSSTFGSCNGCVLYTSQTITDIWTLLIYYLRPILLSRYPLSWLYLKRMTIYFINLLSRTPAPPNARSNLSYNGGKFSLQIGHCNRNLIQPSKHALWKTCLHGVTIYNLLANMPVTPPAFPVESSPAPTTGTSSTCIQIAQSTVLTPPSLFFLPSSSLVLVLSNVGDPGI